MNPRFKTFAVLAAGASLFAATCASPGAESVKEPQSVELRGRVVCVAEEMHRLHAAPLPTNHEHQWGFKAADGKTYTLLRGKFSEAIFADARVRERELLVKARLFPGTQILELTHLRSVKNGVLQDLYYFCAVCAIKSVSPEECACCQMPVELVEKPLKESSE